jgi:hypothetical protein
MFIEAEKKQAPTPSGVPCLCVTSQMALLSRHIALLTECGSSTGLRAINIALLSECLHERY